jgi:DNA polymerase-4
MEQVFQLPTTNRIILHIDMNAFFASVEQQANPLIRNKPVAVVGDPNFNGSAILAASYPAKKFGIGLSTRLGEARQRCPELIAVPLNSLKYYSVNRQLVSLFRSVTPQVEVYSIDEAFLDVTEMAADLTEAAKLAQHISDRIRAEIGEALTCSIGVSHNKLLAKVASDFKKPSAVTVIPWDKRTDYLDQLKFEDIWGIGRHSIPKLRAIGINNTADIRRMSDASLRALVGSYYTRLKMIANGEHYDPVNPRRTTRPVKSMQHAHTMSQTTNDPQLLKSLIRKLSERLAKRLRRHDQAARTISLGLRPANQTHYGWGYMPNYFASKTIEFPTNNGYDIYKVASEILDSFHSKDQIRLLVVGLADLSSTAMQPLAIFQDSQKRLLDNVIDQINNTFGEFTIRSGDILHQRAKDRELTTDRENMTFHPD